MALKLELGRNAQNWLPDPAGAWPSTKLHSNPYLLPDIIPELVSHIKPSLPKTDVRQFQLSTFISKSPSHIFSIIPYLEVRLWYLIPSCSSTRKFIPAMGISSLYKLIEVGFFFVSLIYLIKQTDICSLNLEFM